MGPEACYSSALMIEASVIIPTFNRRRLLARALESVVAQQGVAFEVLVIDDGSSDGTREMVAREFPSVNYFRQENRGPAAARNAGIVKARGKWIAFLDSDDEWLPGKLEAQLRFFSENPDYRVCQTEEIWIRRGKRVNPMKKHRKTGGWIFERCLALCLISPSAVMIRRDVFDSAGVFDESFPACEDYELWLRITARFPIGFIEKPYLRKYGGHEDQRSRAFEAMDLFRIRALAKIIRSGSLDPEKESAARNMLGEKFEIYRKGSLKRGNAETLGALKASVLSLLQEPRAV